MPGVRPRDPREPHRSATPLELFTDLCYVVAIAQAAAELHHSISENHVGEGLLYFAIGFFAIWWAWLNFAWYNSAYDNDDTGNRVLALWQIVGSLVLAAGVPNLFEQDFTLVVVGYSLMRIGLVLMWLRAAAGHPEGAATARRYAAGLFVAQSLWIVFLAVPDAWIVPVFLVFAAVDFAVPVVAESAGTTPWHPHHIAERYGLMFIIVLGETILATTFALQAALDDGSFGPSCSRWSPAAC
ncbi:low temperature requirement protein A [Aeromicrobium marinum]